MKTIIFVTTLPIWSLGVEGKGGAAFYNTLQKYIMEGWNVYLISDDPSNSKYTYISENNNIVVKESKFKKFIQTRKIGLVFRILNHIVTTRRYVKAAEKIIRQLYVDDLHGGVLIYAYEVASVDACKKISVKHHLPLVTRFQGTVLSKYRYSSLNKMLRYPAYQALETVADLVIMTDDGTQGDRVLSAVGNSSKTLFIKNGLEILEGELDKLNFENIKDKHGVSSDELLFLTVSRLTGWKKVDRAIEGFKRYVDLGGKGRLMIVGDGDKRQELESQAVSCCLGDKVIFTGAIKQKEVYSCMFSCDVFLSLYDLSNVGNPLLEALCLGCAIITLDVGDTKNVINGENGIIIKKEELNKLGDIMYKFYENKLLLSHYGNQAKKYAKENLYSWTKRMDIEYEVVSNLLLTDNEIH